MMFAYLRNLINDHSINIGDWWAGGITLAVLFEAIPTITSILGLVWITLRIIVLVRDEFIYKRKPDGDK